MDIFLSKELEVNTQIKAQRINSMAGGSYHEKTAEMNEKIDRINRSNAEAYHKASLFSVG